MISVPVSLSRRAQRPPRADAITSIAAAWASARRLSPAAAARTTAAAAAATGRMLTPSRPGGPGPGDPNTVSVIMSHGHESPQPDFLDRGTRLAGGDISQPE